MLQSLLVFIITLVSFFLGVCFTLFFSKSDTFERVTDRLPKKTPVVTLGPIQRPTAKELYKPKIEEETEEEMAKELRKYLKPNDSD